MTVHRHQYPILELDDNPKAIIEPSKYRPRLDVSPYCIISFFSEVVEAVRDQFSARIVWQQKWEYGWYSLYELEHQDQRIAFFHCGAGAPLAAALLEETVAYGCNKFIAIGGAGIIGERHPVGHLMVPASAIRDEGTSYHYLPPSREVAASPDAVAAIEAVIRERGIDYVLTKTWTTDAPYRETRDMVNLRCGEGCLTVEMEAAGLFAVAQFRNVPLGQILYAGDDLTGEVWDERKWQSRAEIRRDLFWIAAEACWRL